jgi:hypothetical protein
MVPNCRNRRSNCRWRGTQYDGIVAFGAVKVGLQGRAMVKRGLGVSLMMIGMLVAGIVCFLAGLLAIGLGLPINQFDFGNTLILAGTIATGSGLIVLSLWVAVRELKSLAGQFGPVSALGLKGNASQRAALDHPADAEDGGMMQHTDSTGDEQPGGPPPLPPSAPWVEDAAARERPRQEAASQPAPEPAAKPRRNLMFSTTSRRERERSQVRADDAPVADPRPAAGAAPAVEVNEVPPASFDDAWPKSERARPADVPPQRRVARNPSTFSEPPAPRQPPPVESQPPVTVLKAGVVDGMAYSLYSDGSIEAQMPEGMMRFASIDDLRAHLDQRP